MCEWVCEWAINKIEIIMRISDGARCPVLSFVMTSAIVWDTSVKKEQQTMHINASAPTSFRIMTTASDTHVYAYLPP